MKISFIGTGSMATAIISGLIEKDIVQPEQIYATNRGNSEKMAELKETFGIQTTYNMNELLRDARMIVLAVKPKDAAEALVNLQPFIKPDVLFISVMAGISIDFIAEKIQDSCAIARAMPNTSASVGKSATALSFNHLASAAQIEMAVSIFSAVGIVTVVKEQDLDAITGLSGSGPAYIYYVVEAMERAAEEIGIETTTAKELINQTLIGAAEMLSSSGKDAANLGREVTSPGGTTEAGLKVLQEEEVDTAIIKCIKAATAQSKRLRQ